MIIMISREASVRKALVRSFAVYSWVRLKSYNPFGSGSLLGNSNNLCMI